MSFVNEEPLKYLYANEQVSLECINLKSIQDHDQHEFDPINRIQKKLACICTKLIQCID